MRDLNGEAIVFRSFVVIQFPFRIDILPDTDPGKSRRGIMVFSDPSQGIDLGAWRCPASLKSPFSIQSFAGPTGS